MFINEKNWRYDLPLYEVQELSMEEALLVLAAEKEALRGTDATPTAMPPLELALARETPRAVA